MIRCEGYIWLGRYKKCVDPSHFIQSIYQQNRHSNFVSWCAPIQHRRPSAYGHELSWLPTIFLTGVISRFPSMPERLTVSSANGVAGGVKPNRWPMHHVRAHPGVFPPEVRAQVTATACSLPCSQDLPLARWSRVELAK